METGFVQTGSVRLQYHVHGRGTEVVVLVHGFASSGRVWRLTQEAIDPSRYRTIALCNRGAGDSDRSPHAEDYTAESFANDLYAAVQAMDLPRMTLVGHSMGGLTVTHYALAHQDTLKALVLLNPAALDGRTRSTTPLSDDERQALDAIDLGLAPAEFLGALNADVARNPPERAIGGRSSMERARLRERLGELTVPTLVVGGDRDNLVGVENILREYLALPARSRALHIFHGVGHSPNVGVPDQLAAVLDRFIGRASSNKHS